MNGTFSIFAFFAHPFKGIKNAGAHRFRSSNSGSDAHDKKVTTSLAI